jgi:hypothetical protein
MTEIKTSMITVDTKTIESFDKLVRNGIRGIHLLFSNSMIREAFQLTNEKSTGADETLAEKVQTALSDLIRNDDFEKRQETIQSLEPKVRNTLVMMYFDFLDHFYVRKRGREVLH